MLLAALFISALICGTKDQSFYCFDLIVLTFYLTAKLVYLQVQMKVH